MRYFLNSHMYDMIYRSRHIVSNPRIYIKLDSCMYEDLVTLANLKSIYIQQWLHSMKVNYLIYLPNCFVYSKLFQHISSNKESNVTWFINNKALHYLLKQYPIWFNINTFSIKQNYRLSEQFIRYEMKLYGPSLLPWESISQYPKLSLEFVIEFNKYINWEAFVSSRRLSYDDIEILSPYIDWNIISKLHGMDERFLEQVKDKINWDIMSNRRHILDDEQFVIKYQNYINWEILMTNYDDTCYNFIRRYKKKLDIDMLLKKGILTELQAKIFKQQ